MVRRHRVRGGYEPAHAREVALYLSWLAESYARSGALDAAAAVLSRASAKAGVMRSARVDRRLADVAQLLAR